MTDTRIPLNRERLKRMMEQFEVDLLIATSPENVFYTTGYMPFQGIWNRFPKAAVVSRHDDVTTLVLPMNEIGFAQDDIHSPSTELRFFGRSNFADPSSVLDPIEFLMQGQANGGSPNIVDALIAGLGDRLGEKMRIVVDQSGASELCQRLASRIPAARVDGGGEELWRLVRMVKTTQEHRRLSRAIDVNEAGIAAVHANLDNATESELARIFQATIGAAGGNVQHWIGSFGRVAGAYRRPGANDYRSGGRFRFDCGIAFNGYSSDLGGTAQVGGEPSAAERSTYRALTAGIETALEKGRPGTLSSRLYGDVLDAVRRSGLKDYAHTLVGHGIGIEPRDYPILGAPMKSGTEFLGDVFDPLLEAGMVLNIECPIIQLSDGGFQHEVTLVIEENGPRLLSQLREYRLVGASGG